VALIPGFEFKPRLVPSLECLASQFEHLCSPELRSDTSLYSYRFIEPAIAALGDKQEMGRKFMGAVGVVRNYIETQILLKRTSLVIFLRLLAASKLVLRGQLREADQLLSDILKGSEDMLAEASIRGAIVICDRRDGVASSKEGLKRVSLDPDYPVDSTPCALYIKDLFVGVLIAMTHSSNHKFKLGSGIASLITVNNDSIADNKDRLESDTTLLDALELVAEHAMRKSEDVPSTLVDDFFAKARYIDLFALSAFPSFNCGPKDQGTDPWAIPRWPTLNGPSLPADDSTKPTCRKALCELVDSFIALADEYLRIDRWNVVVDWTALRRVAVGKEWQQALSNVEGWLEVHLSHFEKSLSSGFRSDVNQVKNIVRLLAISRLSHNPATEPYQRWLLKKITEEAANAFDWMYQGITKACQQRRISNCFDVGHAYTCHDETIDTSAGWEVIVAIYGVNGWDTKPIQMIEAKYIACRESEELVAEAEEPGAMSYYATFRQICDMAFKEKIPIDEIKTRIEEELVNWKRINPASSVCV